MSSITDSTNTVNATITPNSSQISLSEPFCEAVLFQEIGHDESKVRIWDLIILIPNSLFFLFLLCQFRVACEKLKTSSSPIFSAFYGLVVSVVIIGEIRCIVSMLVNAANIVGDITDRILWLLLRFCLLATEMSVLIFGLAFGHLDSRTSIRLVLIVTVSAALLFSIAQGTLEFVMSDTKRIKSPSHDFDIFGHGGMLFWCASSFIFCVIYFVISILPLLKVPSRYAIPSRKSFYYYSGFLCIMNAANTIGSGLIYGGVIAGVCIVDVSTFVYFAFYAPLIYGTFLREFFKRIPQSILFSYKTQVDEVHDDDHVIMPHQSSSSGTENTGSLAAYDSTQFDTNSIIAHSPNPLYLVANMRGGITDYSIDTDNSLNT